MSILAALHYIPGPAAPRRSTTACCLLFFSSNHHRWPLLPQHAQLLQGDQPRQDQVSQRDNTQCKESVKPLRFSARVLSLKICSKQRCWNQQKRSGFSLCTSCVGNRASWCTGQLTPGGPGPLSVLSHLTTQPADWYSLLLALHVPLRGCLITGTACSTSCNVVFYQNLT